MKWPSLWLTELSNGKTVILVVNWRELPWYDFNFEFSDIGIKVHQGYIVKIRDLILRRDIGLFQEKRSDAKLNIDSIPGHGSKMYEIQVVKNESKL